MQPSRFLMALATLAGGLGSAGVAGAQSCAMCGSSFSPNEPITRAFNASILFLMAAPYALCVGAAASIYLLYRRAAARRRRSLIPLPVRAHRLHGTESQEV